MKIIKTLCEMINEELEGAEHYVKCALAYRDDRQTLSKALYDISTEEMRHASILHDEVVKLIDEYRKAHGDSPVEMQSVYDYVHEQQIEKANCVRMYQSQYRGV